MTDGWAGPRPVQVAIATVLLVGAGIIQLLVAVFVVAALGAIALPLALPIGALGFCAAMFGYRILDGRNRQAALIAAFLTMLTAPFTIPSDFLALTALLCALVAAFILIRTKAWFVVPSDHPAEPPGTGSGPDGDGPAAS